MCAEEEEERLTEKQMYHRTSRTEPDASGSASLAATQKFFPDDDDGGGDDKARYQPPMTRCQQFELATRIAMALALVATCTVLIVYVVRLDPVIARVNELSAKAVELAPQFESKATNIITNADWMVGNVTAKSPLWLNGVDGAFKAMTPDKMKVLVGNVMLLLDSVARENITQVIEKVSDVLTAVNQIVRMDTLQINIPLLSKALAPP